MIIGGNAVMHIGMGAVLCRIAVMIDSRSASTLSGTSTS
jgi:hypothetical protein